MSSLSFNPTFTFKKSLIAVCILLAVCFTQEVAGKTRLNADAVEYKYTEFNRNLDEYGELL